MWQPSQCGKQHGKCARWDGFAGWYAPSVSHCTFLIPLRTPPHVQRSEIATIFSLEQDSKHTWESTKGPKDFGVLGIGSRVCHFLPPKMLVRSRCNCTHAEGKDGADACRAEEKLVAQLVKEGKMPWRDV